MAYFLLVQFGAVPGVRRPHRPSRSLPLVVPILVLSLGLGLAARSAMVSLYPTLMLSSNKCG